MDGRKLFVFGAFALGVCTGCVPNPNKNTSVEAQAPADGASAPSTSLFGGETAKKPKTLELSLAALHEANARRNNDKPDVQFREFDEARKIYHEILNYDPNSIDAYRGLGRVYIGISDWEKASATFKTAIAKQPGNSALYAEHSMVFSKQKNFPEAIRLVSKAVEIDPENQEFQRMLAVYYVCNGQLEQGVAAMTRARGPAAAHYYIARVVFELKGQTDLARAELQKALELNGNLQEARAMLEEMDAGLLRSPSSSPLALPSDVQQASHESR